LKRTAAIRPPICVALIAALVSCALDRRGIGDESGILPMDELATSPAKFNGERISVEGYITEVPRATGVAAEYLAIHGAERMRDRDGKEFYRCFSPTEANVYIGRARNLRGERERLDAHRVIVSGIYRNEAIEISSGTLTLTYFGSLSDARVEKRFAETCTGVPAGASSAAGEPRLHAE
jgi:hypothetical protein